MSDDQTTQSAQGSGIPAPPVIEGGDEVYNKIMGEIEPDLTTDQLPLMDEKYKNESEEDRKARMKRYAEAAKTFKVKYEEFKSNQEGGLKRFKRGAMGAIEEKSSNSDMNEMALLESAISNI